MHSYARAGATATFDFFARSFAARPGCPFSGCLDEQRLEKLATEYGLDFGDVFTPAVTLWAFLSQCLSASKSCVSAVARVMVLRMILETRATSTSSGSAYAPPRLTKPSRFLRNSAAANGSPNSFAMAAVTELPPIGTLREKIFPGSMKRRFVVRAPILTSSEQPIESL